MRICAAGAEVHTVDIDSRTVAGYTTDITTAAAAAFFEQFDDDWGALNIVINNVGIAEQT